MGDSFGEELLAIVAKRFPESELTHVRTLPSHPAQWAPWPEWVLPQLRAHLEQEEITKLYTHQARTAQLAWCGEDVVVSTGTSSGKSLGYQLPVLTRLAQNPRACALYLTPTKALGSDQLHAVQTFTRAIDALAGVHPAPYDGDTPVEARAGIRESSRLVFTNPDMLHASLLANHPRWARFLRHLEFLVVDECHAYRGVFGANVALVLRRLLRLAQHYGSNPTIVFASATAAHPAEQAQRLSGRPAREIIEDGSPKGPRTVALWQPGFWEDATPVRRAATTEAAGIMAVLIAEGARTLTFTRSRAGAEIVARCAQEELISLGRRDFAERVRAYRAGYLAEDRRQLERMLDDGRLLGVASTNALELGIDVGGLDAVVIAGFPGTVASFWQQAGRAGRRGQSSIVTLVARDDPLDTFLVHHPEALLGKPVESSVFNPTNPYVLRDHLYCAAVEKPLSEAEIDALGARAIAQELAAEGALRRRPQGWFAAARPAEVEPNPETAHQQVSLRGGAGREVMIVDTSDGRLLGTVDFARALSQVHPGAVYLHQGATYLVDELDLDSGIALAQPTDSDFSTSARSVTSIRILGEALSRRHPAPGLWVANVEVEVTQQVLGYVQRLADGSLTSPISLDMPPQSLSTRAVAYTIDPLILEELGVAASEVPGTLHAAEHAAIGLLPLIATCDRWDIGGVSTALHSDTGLPTVFVYDGHPGGAGFADAGYARFHQWMEATWEAVRSCECESGCPSCVQSPKCGNGNEPLDKAGALKLLGALVAMTAPATP